MKENDNFNEEKKKQQITTLRHMYGSVALRYSIKTAKPGESKQKIDSIDRSIWCGVILSSSTLFSLSSSSFRSYVIVYCIIVSSAAHTHTHMLKTTANEIGHCGKYAFHFVVCVRYWAELENGVLCLFLARFYHTQRRYCLQFNRTYRRYAAAAVIFSFYLNASIKIFMLPFCWAIFSSHICYLASNNSYFCGWIH